MTRVRIFVYGTLKSTVGSHRPRKFGQTESAWIRELGFIGSGRATGELHDLGEYPGLVLVGGSSAWVHGEIYSLPQDPAARAGILSRMDEYEGCSPSWPKPWEYLRVEIPVWPEHENSSAGEPLSCWSYVCNPEFPWKLDHSSRIADGRW